MADQSIALQVQPAAFDPATPLLNAEKIQYGQTENLRARSQLARDEETHALNIDAGQTSLQRIKRLSQGEDIQYRSQLIRDAAAHAQDPESWDTAMRSAAKNGAPEAAQYVGRYTPLLQQRLFDSYAGAAPAQQGAASGGAAPAQGSSVDLDRQLQGATPQQLGEILRQGDIFLRAISTVKDQASQDQAAAALRAAGVPDQALRAPFNPLNTVKLYNEVSQRNGYIQSRLSPGAPMPQLNPQGPGGAQEQFGSKVDQAFGKPGVTPSYFDKARSVESGGNDNAKSATSSSAGPYGFTKQTWADLAKANPDLGLTPEGRTDPEQNKRAIKAFTKENAAKLSDEGIPANDRNLYMAHFLGDKGAVRFLNGVEEKPNQPAADLVSNDVVDANKNVFIRPDGTKRTAREVYENQTRKFGDASTAVSEVKSSDFSSSLRALVPEAIKLMTTPGVSKEQIESAHHILDFVHNEDKVAEERRKSEHESKAPKVYTDPDSGEQHAIVSKIGKNGELEYFDSNLTKGTTSKLAAPPDGSAPGTPAPTAQATGAPAAAAEDTGAIGANTALVESGPYDYRRTAPPLEKGMDVPEPKEVAGRSTASIKTDAEKYVLTGALPTYRSGNSPIAVRDSSYRNAVQNYGNAIAASRGLTPSELAELHRSAPGMLKFVMGPDGRSTVSLGTAVRHLDTIQNLANAWAANDTRAINEIRKVISTQFGKSAATNLQAAGSIVGPEIIKAIGVAGAGTAEERAKAEKMFSAASSPEQLTGAVKTVQALMGGQLEGRKRQAQAAGVTDAMFKNLIGDRPYEILSHAEGGAKGGEKTDKPAVTLSAKDQQALDWANANPNDPRSAGIKKHLGAP